MRPTDRPAAYGGSRPVRAPDQLVHDGQRDEDLHDAQLLGPFGGANQRRRRRPSSTPPTTTATRATSGSLDGAGHASPAVTARIRGGHDGDHGVGAGVSRSIAPPMTR